MSNDSFLNIFLSEKDAFDLSSDELIIWIEKSVRNLSQTEKDIFLQAKLNVGSLWKMVVGRSSFPEGISDNSVQQIKAKFCFSNANISQSIDFETLPDKIEEINEENVYLLVNSFARQLGDFHEETPNELLLFVRSGDPILWNALNDANDNVLISGSPGIGKSSLVWHWCCWKSREQKEPVYWIHANYSATDFKFATIVIFTAKGNIFQLKNFEVDRSVYGLLEPLPGNIFVFDGILWHTYAQGLTILTLWHHRKKRMIFCTSSQVPRPSSSQSSIRWHRVESYSWTLFEIETACNLPAFYKQISKFLDAHPNDENFTQQEKIKSKYYIAGGSAKLMFGMETEDVIDMLITKIRSSDINYLLSGTPNPDFRYVHNHLLTTVKGSWVQFTGLLSRWIFNQIQENATMLDISRILNANLWNGLQGPHNDWVFECCLTLEIQYHSHLKQDDREIDFKHFRKLSSNNVKSDPKKSLPLCQNVRFWNFKDFASEKQKFKSDCWIVPKLWNNPTFDCALYLAQKQSLTVVQCTRSDSRALNMKHITALIHGLTEFAEINVIELKFIFVVPVAIVGSFRLNTSESLDDKSLAAYGFKIDDIEVYGYTPIKSD